VTLLVPFGIFGATVFAEPTVTEIEEVVCLLHVIIRTGSGSDRVERS
jgi:hypothetical protein